MDLNQPKPLMKLPISIEQVSLQFYTSVLIVSATNLNFVREEFLTRNNLLGKCIHGLEIAVRIANEQRISTSKKNSPMFRLVRKSSLDSNLQSYHTSNVCILSLVFQ